ncbi:nucleotidyl transferase AbiEii/AbiGii toxin family protein [uncultured Traorella sp.]|uniref:nucleotidyl transferase AbiEii/AbiGii toxin family protein n=1 Tax=uncultured Traorella sp. TaxID=1929048 RepID=UPI0025CB9121|nr:nucleotidyl transferase AbiEii/AbiGii toxin family protein [uncultured Traorella sp.]
MRTPEQLKGIIRNLAKEKGIHAQEILQIYMFERIIERLSVSPYKDNFILKGGLLISAILGIEERTTMDMDTTIKGLLMKKENIKNIINEILNKEVNDGIEFQLIDVSPIREEDKYENFRVSIQAVYGKMKIPMKIDITTGDVITPQEVQFLYPLLLEDRHIKIKAYTQETIMAEKFETIMSRNVGNTRTRDFYDLHLLYHLYHKNANWNILKEAVFATADRRGSLSILNNIEQILVALNESDYLKDSWKRYQSQNLYARNISYSDIMKTMQLLIRKII